MLHLSAEETYDEKTLLQRIAESDEEAFRMIFDRYKQRFYFAALKMTRSPHTAEEIVQEAFITLWSRRSVLGKVEYPSTYLFTIVYNSIYTCLKRTALERKMKSIMAGHLQDQVYVVEEALADKENQQLLYHLIRQLPPQQQLVFKLSRQEGLSRNEIADRLDISPHTVKNHLQEAVKFLRTRFNKIVSILICIF